MDRLGPCPAEGFGSGSSGRRGTGARTNAGPPDEGPSGSGSMSSLALPPLGRAGHHAVAQRAQSLHVELDQVPCREEFPPLHGRSVAERA